MNLKTTDFKRNSLGRARIYECHPPPPSQLTLWLRLCAEVSHNFYTFVHRIEHEEITLGVKQPGPLCNKHNRTQLTVYLEENFAILENFE